MEVLISADNTLCSRTASDAFLPELSVGIARDLQRYGGMSLSPELHFFNSRDHPSRGYTKHEVTQKNESWGGRVGLWEKWQALPG